MPKRILEYKLLDTIPDYEFFDHSNEQLSDSVVNALAEKIDDDEQYDKARKQVKYKLHLQRLRNLHEVGDNRRF